MGMIVLLVFFGAFSVVALLLVATGSGTAQQAKQVLATLDSALATDSQETRDQILDLRKKELFSGIPWLNRKLINFRLAPILQSVLNQADLKWTAGQLIAMCACLCLIPGYIVFWRFGMILPALVVGLALGATPIAYVFFKRSKRFNQFQQGLPEAIDLMVSALRAGHSLIAAMGLVARECADPIGCEFRACFEEQNYGLELRAALDNLITRIPLQDLRIVATAISIQKESGGNLAEVLDKTAHVIRERFRLKRQIATHTAQGRLTGWILTFLPVVLGFALYTINGKMMSLLWTTPIGVELMWIASGMIVVGGFIIRNIVNMEV